MPEAGLPLHGAIIVLEARSLLQQKRRMRSKEMHYIDHPLIGVVIKFMPLDEEQLQVMADAEFAEETNQAL